MLARGGSKGIPNKNLKLLRGKPLIYYTIKAVQDSGVFDRFILSTDSQEISVVAKRYGVEVPFLRPEELAKDDSPALDAIEHALKWIVRTAKDICSGIKVLFEKNADMVISVCQTSHPPYWSNVLPDDHSLKGFIKPEHLRNRQEVPVTYRLNGAIYVAKWDVFYEKRNWYEQNTYAYIMPVERSVDIDFKLAELLLREQGI